LFQLSPIFRHFLPIAFGFEATGLRVPQGLAPIHAPNNQQVTLGQTRDRDFTEQLENAHFEASKKG